MTKLMTPEEFAGLVTRFDAEVYQHRNAQAEYDNLIDAYSQLYEQNRELVEAARKVIQGFEMGVFGRNTDKDTSSSWAIEIVEYIQALAALQKVGEE